MPVDRRLKYGHHQLEEIRRASQLWLTQHIPGAFWDLFQDFVVEYGESHRDKVSVWSERAQLSPQSSLIDVLASDGGIRPWSDVELGNDQKFHNRYGEVVVIPPEPIVESMFRDTWATSRLSIMGSSREIMLHLGAFLGYRAHVRCKQLRRHSVIELFEAQVENSLFAIMLKNGYYGTPV